LRANVSVASAWTDATLAISRPGPDHVKRPLHAEIVIVSRYSAESVPDGRDARL